MTGRAVETTRLSSEAMKRAKPVTTTAQIALDLVAGEIDADDPLGPEPFASVPAGGRLTDPSNV
jgi:hypothetical protein